MCFFTTVEDTSPCSVMKSLPALVRRPEVKMGDLLGMGSFGKVHSCEVDGVAAVCKSLVYFTKDAQSMFERECRILKELKEGPNIIQILHLEYTEGILERIFLTYGGMDLFTVSTERRPFLHKVLPHVLLGMLTGAAFMHSRLVYHRDIKLENLTVDDYGTVHYIDLGLAVQASSPFEKFFNQCGSTSYVAPEMVEKKHYLGAQADSWSIGVAMFALLSEFFPFKCAGREDWRFQEVCKFQSGGTGDGTMEIITRWYPDRRFPPSGCNSLVRWLVDGFLTVTPWKRRTVQEAFEEMKSRNLC